ncbi:hypothetical protein [Pseudoalteromonas tunicata]|uniref:Putative orphan protein n=1 Tax=Pseudoalteromonas tunicata D2 TaxID=87626 RepID=A4C5Y5_9GAMM|nr:hypothetical protein [Pseudoalteromonas tunicata]ATC95362.1 hypothetical protein PTUN_a2963 [Pseudoalteromonas tunicata]AXT30949.1 hypothetical protein D1819_09200 [Pseudoalteromonas tunicata]EAR29389.1 putative orphan protein [Pseudoalteromonas tunicata D2]MDP4984369.1 hypothetical protein [Pseudoalteromonas tunicata]MDP5213064.1 hypothetical protein [Pseudoalteromonas tunicata]
MKDSAQVGQSIIAKAHFGVVIAVFFLVVSYFLTPLLLDTLMQSTLAGLICALLLLGYWRGKGGLFFILALVCPLILIVMAHLPTFFALLQLISGYFLGLSALLSAFYWLVQYKKAPH